MHRRAKAESETILAIIIDHVNNETNSKKNPKD